MPAINLVGPLSQSLPLWLVGLLLILACVAVLEAGAWIARGQLAGTPASERSRAATSDAQGYVIGAIFGLLAFLIGLTFSIALDRHDSRRSWVSEEATALSTAYLRADLFDEPERSKLRATIREYTQSRIIPDDLKARERDDRERLSEALGTRLWREARSAILPIRDTERGSYFVEAVNNALDVGTRRSLAGREQIPPQIIDVQLVYLIVAAGVLGYVLGMDNSRRRYASTLLIFLFVLAFVLILDIDRPRSGTINVSQRGLEQLRAQMVADAGREVEQNAQGISPRSK